MTTSSTHPAARAVESFFDSWSRLDFHGMKANTQLTWLDGPYKERPGFVARLVRRISSFLQRKAKRADRWNALESLTKMFESTKPLEWRVVNSKHLTEVLSDVTVDAKVQIGNSKIRRRFICRVIAETAPYQTDVSGRWGVNPISVWRKK